MTRQVRTSSLRDWSMNWMSVQYHALFPVLYFSAGCGPKAFSMPWVYCFRFVSLAPGPDGGTRSQGGYCQGNSYYVYQKSLKRSHYTQWWRYNVDKDVENAKRTVLNHSLNSVKQRWTIYSGIQCRMWRNYIRFANSDPIQSETSLHYKTI